MHDGQLTVTASTARTLAAEQFLRWAGLAVLVPVKPGEALNTPVLDTPA